jgi:N-methylhydantoinase B
MMRADPTELEIFKNLFHSVAEEMGAALRRSGFSPNIKERRDYSCAVFDGAGRAVAMGDHMPVHLGSMPASVAAAMAAFSESGGLGPGDVAVLNDPFAGGTHLPDLTMVAPVFADAAKRKSAKPFFYVANRAHHSDIGGAQPASMGLSEEIYQEGLRIPPVRLFRQGKMDRDVLALILANVRTPEEREGDLTAQIAACRLGDRRLRELAEKYGARQTRFYLDALQNYSARLMRQTLREIPDGVYRAEDFLDDDGYTDSPLALRVAITVRGERARVDFSGTAPACRGSMNAVLAITQSAVFYVFRCLLGEDVPACAGLMDPIEVSAPEGSIVNARPPVAVAAGNVETSQRIVDVLLRALARALPERIPAASSGTMNNLSFGGISGAGQPFAYYETVAGGMGARPSRDGLSGIHTHMTNSLNTPTEALESALPVRVRRYSLRGGSGGAGRYKGGDGIVREIEFLTETRGSILSDRRRCGPYGLAGGRPGKPGRNELILPSGRKKALPSKATFHAPKGSVFRVETPGGGGWGK